MKQQGSNTVRNHLEDGFEETYDQVHCSLIKKLSSEIKHRESKMFGLRRMICCIWCNSCMQFHLLLITALWVICWVDCPLTFKGSLHGSPTCPEVQLFLQPNHSWRNMTDPAGVHKRHKQPRSNSLPPKLPLYGPISRTTSHRAAVLHPSLIPTGDVTDVSSLFYQPGR